jgi:putative DNA primase/helicase
LAKTKPSNVKAKSNDPATWVDFESAVKAFERGGFDGVGFVFAKDGGIVGVDLDWKDWDGEGVPPEVQTIVDRLNSYTEWSPSRKGCHILLRGKLPAGIGSPRCDHRGVRPLEVFHRDRGALGRLPR